MMMHRKNLLMIVMAITMVMLPVTASLAATAIDIPAGTLKISMLGDLTLVVKEGVPQAIVVRGRDLSGMGVDFSINGTPYMGDVMVSNNLTLLPATMPLMFEHYGVVEITAGANMLVLKYNGSATKTKDVAMMTKTLNSSGDFVVADATGAFADLKGMKGTYKATLMCHIVPGEHPMVGSPVEVMFSAMGE
jgi:hypothetical protein